MSVQEEIRQAAREATVHRLTTSGDLTQDGLALRLGELWKDDARHVAPWGRWLFFEGGVWRMDECLEHMTRTRDFLRDLAEQLPPKEESAANRLRQADTVAKVVGLARSNLEQRAVVEMWDADLYELGHSNQGKR
ncbi:MAG: hypothetical protein GEU90_21105 [Gemmatimonas sp.]|nr:hypothetical protein [Gemmatimonas sp.]